jgi:hypothetical protein
MVPARRQQFLTHYSAATHEAMKRELVSRVGVPIEFRLSETPCFLPASLGRTLIDAAEHMIHQLLDDPAYMKAADAIVPPEFRLAHGEPRPTFMQIDFGLVKTERGFEGRLVELQAFASLYGFQLLFAEASRDAWHLEGVTPFFDGLTRQQYIDLVKQAIAGDHDPNECVLLEIEPEHQKTRPDFAATEQLWGVRAIDLRSVTQEGRRLYTTIDGKRTRIAKIYNRVIPDELHKRYLTWPFDLSADLDVEWAGGPDWYFRISKFAIPWLKHPWVPKTQYLSDVTSLPADRENLVLKPLFSFAGGGVTFNPTDEQLNAIPAEERRNYALQERVRFTPTVETPHGPTQIELRLMFVRDGDRYRCLLPLGRMGRGLMMGVDYNKGLEWVGAAAVLVDPAA